MTLREGDLQNTVLKKVSIDEFEPKTGKSENVMVLGFHVNDQHPGKDLYKYLNNSIHEIRDVEVSPNPNEDGFYMVFLEIDRKEGVLDVVKDIVKEVENLSGKLKWNISTPLAEELIDLTDDRLANYIQQNEGQFLSKQEFDQIQVEAQQVEEEKRLEEEAQSNTGKILEFLQDSNLLEAGINDGDTVIVKKASNVDSGQIAVVLIDDQEATLKRIRKKGNTIALEAANRNYGTKIYASNRIKIQGKLVSLYRNFH